MERLDEQSNECIESLTNTIMAKDQAGTSKAYLRYISAHYIPLIVSRRGTPDAEYLKENLVEGEDK